MKKCSKCKVYIDTILFSKSKTNKDGFCRICKTCKSMSDAIYYKEHADRIVKKNSEWARVNSEKTNSYKRAWKKSNSEKNRTINTAYAKNNPDKINAKSARWQRNNPDKVNANTTKRRAVKLKRTPSWLNAEHLNKIQYFYTLAKVFQYLFKEPLQVDHIIPLQGKNVSGLHVPWNLQVLTRSENISKGNKLINTNI